VKKKKKGKKKKKPSKYAGILLGMGNPLLDISAEVPMEVLNRYGVQLNNAILAEPKHLPMYQELVDKFNVQYIAGGATQNTIRVAQWMLQKPGATGYIGAVGKDKFGEQLKKSAEQDGIKTHYYQDEKTPTGTCAVLIHDKERSLIANLAAANSFKPDHLRKPEIEAVWTKAKFYYIAGFFLTVSPESIMMFARHAHETKKTFAMNLSAPFICEFFTKPLLDALPFADFIFGNEGEARAFGKAMKYKDDSPASVATQLAQHTKENKERPRVAIITQGADPTLVFFEGKIHSIPVPPISPSAIVDVNGAGDAFVGGFLAWLVKGHPVLECVRAGQYASRVILQVSGTVLKGKPSFG